jgi:hypothetical protein
MDPTYPSAEELQSWLVTLTQHTTSREEAAQRLRQTYWESSVEDIHRAAVQQDQEDQVSQHQLMAELQAYEDRAAGAWAGPGVIAGYLGLRIAPDLSTPPSGDQVLCVYACVRVWKEKALGLALVRDVLAFLQVMVQEPRLYRDQRKQARDLLQRLLAPLLPPLNTGGPSTTDLRSLWWLRAMLEDYERERDKMRPILRRTNNAKDRLSALQVAYPDIPVADLSHMMEIAPDKSDTRLRPSRLAVAWVARKYHISLNTTRTALKRATTDRQRQKALQKALRSHRASS